MERVLIKFTKSNEAKFISHLDTMRTLSRVLRRAGIEVVYSKGFNPHPNMSIAAPLSLGISSEAEYIDMEIENHVEESELISRLNKELPRGMQALKAKYIDKDASSAMASVGGAQYNLVLKHDFDLNALQNTITSILASGEIVREKKSKAGNKMVNIRPLIKDIQIKSTDNTIMEIQCFLYSGSRGNLNPDIIIDLIKENSQTNICGTPSITRKTLFAVEDGVWIEFDEYFSRK